MTSEKSPFAKYKALTEQHLARRAGGPLPMAEELRISDELMELWKQLSEVERAELETRFEARKQALRSGARLNPHWQQTIGSWARRVLGDASLQNRPERALRVAEEAVELAQCMGVEADQLHRLVDYVYARPPGTPEQEIAGTLVTLYAAAVSVGADAEEELRREVERIHRPEIEEKVRRRQAEKRAIIGGGSGSGGTR